VKLNGPNLLLLGFATVVVAGTAYLSYSTMRSWDLAEERRLAAIAEAAAAVEAERMAAEAAVAARAAALEAERQAALDAVIARAAVADLQRARFDPLHFKPAIDDATDAQCLVCHAEILETVPLEFSPAGVPAATAVAWYQTLDTYAGEQAMFHARHISTPFAQEVMSLGCTFCHQGNDPRQETPSTLLEQGRTQIADDGQPAFALRKMVEPTQVCLRCHGTFSYEIMGLAGPWHEEREFIEDGEFVKNGCLTCHADTFRTERHQVTYLHAARIEELAQESSDTCFGCHGGRAWYRIGFPYPRTPWPGMAPDVPEWATDRPTQSEERYRLTADE
jgi:hypothetical protein